VEKRVIPWNPNLGQNGDWDDENADSVRRFIYYNWLPLLELDATDPENVTILRKYTWGLDLAGQGGGQSSALSAFEGAGGTLDRPPARQGQVSGLLAAYDTNGTPGDTGDDLSYIYFYDAYGNNLLDPSESGPYANHNPFRFSTKYFDDETGLGYWGYRYYSPRLGRWTSRDLVGERPGAHLCSYIDNDPVDHYDFLGLVKGSTVWTSCKQSCAPQFGIDPQDHAAMQLAYDTNRKYKKCVDKCIEMRKKNKAVFEPDLPTTGDEPGYDPDDWNEDEEVTLGSNCYAYAMCHKREKQRSWPHRPDDPPQPGERSGCACEVDCDIIEHCLMADAAAQGKTITPVDCDACCGNGTYKVMLFITSTGDDYHWCIQNKNECGTWSHKRGGTPCSDRDASGCKIGDPRKGNRNYGSLNYDHPCGCFCIPKEGIEVGP